MKKITLLYLTLLLSFTGFAQFTEGFEGTAGPDLLPSTNWTLASGNWAVFDNNVGTVQRWKINTTASNVHGGSIAAYVQNENVGAGFTPEDYLATPLVTIPANGQLHFWARTTQSGDQGTSYYLKINNTVGTQTTLANYTTVQQWTEATLSTSYNVYEEKVVNLSAYAGQQVYLAFMMTYTQASVGIAGDRWLLDDVNLVQQCMVPTNIVINPASTTASISWNDPNGATSWQIEVVPSTSTLTGVGTVITSNPYVITGLTPNTSYICSIKPICSSNNEGPWIIPGITFTTTIAPVGCNGNYVDSGGATGAYSNNQNITTLICPDNPTDLVTVTFTSFATENCCDHLAIYSGSSVATGTLLGTYQGTTIPPAYTSTTPGGCLTFVFTSDGSVTAAGWVANITCAPAPSCSKPTSLTAIVTSTTANLSWNQPANPNSTIATAWEVIALPCGSAVPSASTVGWQAAATNPFVISGLTASTCYDFYVRAICSASDSSVSSIKATATTQVAPPVCGGLFLDSGGTTASYANNENITSVICPAAGEIATVTFTSFATENCCDHLSVYNGSSVATGALIGTYQGTTLPPVFTSNTPGGCLTFVFTSDSSVTAAGWVANITCAPAPSCTKPIGLTTSQVLSNSVNLAWTQPQNPDTTTASAWQVIALPCGSAAPTAATTGWTPAPSNPFTLSGLNPYTCYDYYVRAACSATDLSDWSVKATATTQTLAPLCGQTFYDTGGAASNYSNNETSITTICPSTTSDLVTVTFTSFNTQATNDVLTVYDGSNNLATLLGAYSGTTLPPVLTSSVPGGCLYFVFTSNASTTRAGWVANVTCAPAPTCTRPKNLVAAPILSTSATLAWTQPQNPDTTVANSWQVIAVPCGSAAPTAATTGWTTAPTNPFVLTGLSASTCYDFYVRATCSATDNSDWSIKATGTTQILPPACGGLFLDSGGVSGSYVNNENITTTICPDTASNLVTVTFTSFATENCCDHLSIYDGSSVATGTLLGTFQGTTLPPEFTSSTPGGCLTFVFTSDGSVSAAGWVANVTCAPAPTCSKPTSLTVVPSSTTATLNWTQPQNPGGGTATAWNLIVQPAGAGAPAPGAVGVTVTSLPYVVTGLTVGTNYEYWVSAICSTTDSSTWAGPKPFFTSVSCGDSQPFCGNTGLSYQNTTGAPSYGTVGCLFTTPNPAWYYMQVQQTGTLSFQIAQTSTGGTGLDVDYICWGPFTASQYAAMCSNLYNFPSGNTAVPNNVVSCSYSIAAIENFTITNAVNGNYYLVLITNFSNQAGSITFTQTNNGSTGAGTTNCNIVCSVDLGPSQVTLCNQASYTITSTNENADSYAWYNGTTLIPGQTGSTLTVTQSGTYQCVITCGLNTANDTITVTFNTQQTPTFNPIANICQFGTAPSLPATSSNGITGTWSPATIDTSVAGTVVYTFTPTTGLCATTATLSVTIDPKTVTNFNAIPSICQNAVAPLLPTTSIEGITGTWAPPTISTTTPGTTVYTFTPTSGICATTASLTVSVSATITPTFNAISSICLNSTAPALPTTSIEGVTGTWLPATIDTSVVGTTIYNFTPDAIPAQSCAVAGSISVTVTGLVSPTFAAIPNICQFGSAPALPTSSIEGFVGTWSPATIDTSIAGTVTYTFTPSAIPSQACAIASTISVTIDPQLTPTFAPVADICVGTTLAALPTTSINLINGSWSPALNNLATTTYTFTPSIGQCATIATMTINVVSQITPLFNPIATVCGGTIAPALPSTSLNSISGTWIPAIIDTTTAGTFPYVFTPSSSACAVPTTIYVTVSTVPTPVVSVITQPSCTVPTGNIEVTSPLSITGNLPSNLFISEVTDAGSGSLTYVEIFNGTGATIDLANYKLKFYNNGNSTTSCDLALTGIITNNSTNVIKVSNAPNETGITPDQSFTTCGGINTDDNIRLTTSTDVEIDNWGRTDGVQFTPNNAPGYVYRRLHTATLPSMTWNSADWTAIAPEDYSDIAQYPPFFAPVQYEYNVDGGTYQSSPIFNGLTPGSHTVTVRDTATGCISAITTVIINTPPATLIPTFNAIAPICNGDALTLPVTSIEGFTGSWSPAVNNTVTTTYTFTPDAGQCAINATFSVVVNQPVQATFNAIAPICNGDTLILPTTSIQGFTGTWDLVANNTATTTYTFTPTAGQCSLPNTLTVVVNQPVQATFNAIAPICNGDTLTLPVTSIEGFAGTWSPAVNNTVTTTYTFTPATGLCASSNTLTVVVNQPVQATFNAIAAICNGDALTLPATSIEGYAGTWSPAVDNTVTTTYTFTPAAGQCASSNTLTVVVNQPVQATFNAIAAICNGDALSLPATSLQGFTGTWTPAINNTVTTTYTFTPAVGQCASSNTLTVLVNQPVTATFNAVPAICNGGTVSLPTTSIEGFTGTWSPAINNTATTIYTFTPTTGQCAANGTLTVTVNQPVQATFNPYSAVCNGDVITLPTTSIEGFIGSWSPAVNNTVTTTYTFTPAAGQCAANGSLTITVNQPIMPTFTAIAALCIGDTAPALSLTSNNGYVGTWNPAVINNTLSGVYTFTPAPGQCATTATLSVTVQAAFDFELTDGCLDNKFNVNVIPSNNTFDPNTASYSWQVNGVTISNQTQVSFDVTNYVANTTPAPVLPLTITATVTTAQSCSKAHSVVLDRIYCEIQNGISPNNDGNNEYFDLRLMNVSNLEIYNRYGTKVYGKTDYSREWVGQDLNGNDLPDGTYYYMIEFSNNQSPKTGWIYINRDSK